MTSGEWAQLVCTLVPLVFAAGGVYAQLKGIAKRLDQINGSVAGVWTKVHEHDLELRDHTRQIQQHDEDIERLQGLE